MPELLDGFKNEINRVVLNASMIFDYKDLVIKYPPLVRCDLLRSRQIPGQSVAETRSVFHVRLVLLFSDLAHLSIDVCSSDVFYIPGLGEQSRPAASSINLRVLVSDAINA
jgi:hypothetical protein